MSARWKILGGGMLLTWCLLAAAGCSGPETADSKSARPADGPRRGGTLVVGLPSEPDSLNIYLARTSASLLAAHRILPRLAVEQMPDELHAAGFEPLLARSWQREDDGRTLTFALHEGGRWSDGSPITCDDVAFTLRAQTDPNIGWPGASIKRHIEAIECPDSHTVRIRYDSAYPGMVMDANDLHVLPASLSAIPFEDWRDVNWPERMPAAGPFKIASRSPGQELVLDRHDGYFAATELPWLDRVVFRIVPDQSSRLTQLLTGDLDVILRLSPNDAARVSSSPDTRVVRRPGAAYTYVGWNTLDPDAYREYRKSRRQACKERGDESCPDDRHEVAALAGERPHKLFGDPRVRRALTLALDRETLVDSLLLGEGSVPTSPMLAPLPEHDPKLQPWPYDIAAARRLLAEAGFRDADGDGILDKNGRKFSFRLNVQAGNKLRRDAAVLIQQDLAKIGVQVEVAPIENSSFYATLARREMDAWIGSWLTSLRVDMNEALTAEACGSEGNNFGSFSHGEADAIALHARDILEDDARAAAWRKWEREFHELQPYTVLYQPNRLTGVRQRVHGTESILPNDDLAGIERWWVD